MRDEELERYRQQLLIEGFGQKAQKKLKQAKVLVAGIGGLGCPASIYLTASGIGSLTLVDNGEVELSNLNRQILYHKEDVGEDKVTSAAEKLQFLNPEIEILAMKMSIEEVNAQKLIKGKNVVVDGLDNWRTRFILNEICVKEKVPLIHAGVFALYGQITTIFPGKGPCLRCIIKKMPSEKQNLPVLGATPGVLGLLEVFEVIKLITGIGKPLIGRVLSFDGEDTNIQIINVKKDPECPVCKYI